MSGCVVYALCDRSTPHAAHQWVTTDWKCCPGIANPESSRKPRADR